MSPLGVRAGRLLGAGMGIDIRCCQSGREGRPLSGPSGSLSSPGGGILGRR